jgi:hypothetical protein
MTAPTVGGDTTHVTGDVMSWNPNDPPITIEQMIERGKLITLDQGREVLQATEPLAYVGFETGERVRFRVEDGWNNHLDQLTSVDEVPAFVTLGGDVTGGGTEYQLTLDALKQAAGQFGYGTGLVDRTPGHLLEDNLNWWFRTGLDKQLQLMVVGDGQVGSAFTRESVTPFSNLAILDKMLEVVDRHYPGMTVFVDRNKLSHSLRLTHLQLVLPELAREIDGTGEVDDRWWAGMQLTNSMTAEKQTEMAAFMFRQRCTNGYIDVLGDEGTWSRKTNGQEMGGVLAWAESAVEDAIGHYDGMWNRVQSLVGMEINPGNLGATATDLFERYRIPTAARKRIIDRLVETDQLTMYALTNAVTEAANGAVGVGEQQRLMRTGGDVIRHAERCDSCHRAIPDGVDHGH